jgi:hypothetical protein
MKYYSFAFFAFEVAIIISMICYFLTAQSLFIQHTIDNNFIGACSVCSYDMDGDGELDILSSGNSGNHIAWWKIEKESALTFTKFVVTTTAPGIIFVDAADIDGDNDMDILGASWQGNKIAIWKNLGGIPILWEQVVVDNNIVQAHEVHAAYVDADSLLDLIAASGGSHQIIWYRNNGETPIIWEKNVVDNQFTGARSVACFDMNGDGYNDLIGAALTANQVSIWYNDGANPIEWNKQIIDNICGGAHWVHFADLDKDDDQDILAAGAIPGLIAWYRNDGGIPLQWTRQLISNNFSGALSVSVADLDLDNDADVFGAATNANRVSWWENNGGNPIQWFNNSILTNYSGAWPVFAVDLEADGDTDILTTASTGNKVTLLENTTITVNALDESSNLSENFFLAQNYPNPFNPSTIIKYQIPCLSLVTIKIYDALGNEIVTLVSEEKQAGSYEVQWYSDGLPSGIYFYELRAQDFVDVKKMILLK